MIRPFRSYGATPDWGNESVTFENVRQRAEYKIGDAIQAGRKAAKGKTAAAADRFF